MLRSFVDIIRSDVVEITINADGTRMWIDTEKGNVCRIYNIGKLVLRDMRNDAKDTSTMNL